MRKRNNVHVCVFVFVSAVAEVSGQSEAVAQQTLSYVIKFFLSVLMTTTLFANTTAVPKIPTPLRRYPTCVVSRFFTSGGAPCIYVIKCLKLIMFKNSPESFGTCQAQELRVERNKRENYREVEQILTGQHRQHMSQEDL